MSKFVKNVVIEEVFEGDTVRVTCQPMKKSSAIKMYSMKKAEGEIPAGAVETMQAEFADHVLSIAGLKDSDGTAVTWEEARDSAYFIPLFITVATKWFERSIPGN